MCAGVGPLPVAPSPKDQAKLTIEPSGSVDCEPFRPIVTFGAAPPSGPAFAVGGRFVTVIVAVSVADAPRSSTIVSVAVYVPADV